MCICTVLMYIENIHIYINLLYYQHTSFNGLQCICQRAIVCKSTQSTRLKYYHQSMTCFGVLFLFFLFCFGVFWRGGLVQPFSVWSVFVVELNCTWSCLEKETFFWCQPGFKKNKKKQTVIGSTGSLFDPKFGNYGGFLIQIGCFVILIHLVLFFYNSALFETL